MSTEHPFHPAAAIFPLMDGDEFDELVESIRAHGLRETIKLHEGQVIDGRNRLTACRMAGVEPQFEPAKVNGSAADYVYDLNYHRRHMTDGGRALAAARYKDVAAAEAKERQRSAGGDRKSEKAKSLPPKSAEAVKGDARDIAAKKYGIGHSTVDAAEKVTKKAAPEVIKAVERGELKVSTAARLAEAPKKVQAAAVREGKAAVRKAIESHSPSPSEEARNDPGVRWHRAMHDIRVRLTATREAGGARALCRQWTAEQKAQYVTDLQEFIEEFHQWIEALKAT